MELKRSFSETLVFLADLTGKTLTEQIHNFYLNELEPFGLERVIPALRKYASKAKWPSVDDIKEMVGVCPDDIDIEQQAELFVRKIGKLIENPGGSTERHCKWAQEAMTPREWEIVNSFMSWSTLTNGDVIDSNRLQFELNSLKKYFIALKEKQAFEKHEETMLSLKPNVSDTITKLLDSKIQKQIDEIPF